MDGPKPDARRPTPWQAGRATEPRRVAGHIVITSTPFYWPAKVLRPVNLANHKPIVAYNLAGEAPVLRSLQLDEAVAGRRADGHDVAFAGREDVVTGLICRRGETAPSS